LICREPAKPNNNVRKLAGIEGYRLRVGDWRVVYTLRHGELTVVVVRIGHRSEVYERRRKSSGKAASRLSS
jgi:mRNA interferase RelE/StbE